MIVDFGFLNWKRKRLPFPSDQKSTIGVHQSSIDLCGRRMRGGRRDREKPIGPVPGVLSSFHPHALSSRARHLSAMEARRVGHSRFAIYPPRSGRSGVLETMGLVGAGERSGGLDAGDELFAFLGEGAEFMMLVTLGNGCGMNSALQWCIQLPISTIRQTSAFTTNLTFFPHNAAPKMRS